MRTGRFWRIKTIGGDLSQRRRPQMDPLCGNAVCGLALFQMREYGARTKTCTESLFARRRSPLGKDKITGNIKAKNCV
jgi:hypothetical protein